MSHRVPTEETDAIVTGVAARSLWHCLCHDFFLGWREAYGWSHTAAVTINPPPLHYHLSALHAVPGRDHVIWLPAL